MFKIIKNAWAIPDLRKKILYTFLIILIFRLGAAIPVPFLDVVALKDTVEGLTAGNTIITYLNVLSGGAFENATIFAMSVQPYINASIIMQLLAVAIPALERLSKEGEEGRKKLGQYTRYATIALGLLQGFAFYKFLDNSGVVDSYPGKFWNIYIGILITLIFTAGSALMMWLGEQINQKGIGNGISIILFAGIVSRAPSTFAGLYVTFVNGISAIKNGAGAGDLLYVVGIILLFVVVVGFIVFMNGAERRIPIQYAKRVVGRKMYGGQSTHIPIKVNMSGVLPIIFASSIISIPATIQLFVYGSQPSAETQKKTMFKILGFITSHMWLYAILFFVLIILFAYFYVTIQYNPIEMANNLRKNSGAIPGIRPGKPTSDYIQKIISKITLIGALFLSVIAIAPIIFGIAFGKSGSAISGTSIIILVGVALETVQQIESQMLMRHYKGFLE